MQTHVSEMLIHMWFTLFIVDILFQEFIVIIRNCFLLATVVLLHLVQQVRVCRGTYSYDVVWLLFGACVSHSGCCWVFTIVEVYSWVTSAVRPGLVQESTSLYMVCNKWIKIIPLRFWYAVTLNTIGPFKGHTKKCNYWKGNLGICDPSSLYFWATESGFIVSSAVLLGLVPVGWIS